MKILIISSVFYPRSSPRGLRATELAKYFASKGHEVISYACLGDYDYSEFQNETGIKVKNIPNRHFAKQESDGTGKQNIFDKISRKLFGRYLEWPNIELAFKMKSIIRAEENIDLLISIAVPYPIHWGISWIRSKYINHFPKVWISDCGDPYMGNTVGRKKPIYFKFLEKMWVERTDYITVPIKESINAYPAVAKEKICVIPQGFDFKSTPLAPYRKHTIPTFAYAGAIYPGYRDPSAFLEYLTTVNYDFKFIVYTRTTSIFDKYKIKLGDRLEIRDYIPRKNLIFILSQMDFLINIKNSSLVQSPSKLIDYALTKRPILSISYDFSESKRFESFVKSDYSENQYVEITNYDINKVGQQFIDLFETKMLDYENRDR